MSIDYNGLLNRVGEFDPATHYMAGVICDTAVTQELRFLQTPDGRYSVQAVEQETKELPEWAIGAATLRLPGENPPHNPHYVTIELDSNGKEYRYTGYDNLDSFGRANGFNLNALRHSFRETLAWFPSEYVIVGDRDYRGNWFDRRIGLRLNALPMARRLVSRTSLDLIYDYYQFDKKARKEKAREMFIAFADAVLMLPEEQ